VANCSWLAACLRTRIWYGDVLYADGLSETLGELRQQKLGACGVVGCHQRNLLNITVQCQTIILRFIQMLIMM